MDQFIQKFIEEASDMINELEEVSLLLEKDTSNKEIIERIKTESQTEKKMEAKNSGATGWITKLFVPDKLLITVNKVIR
ncbi:MAG: hypothetical protein KAT68_15690 [Bacteroidales bacterium]|nr:hypothetical protein [Bacteroidales bacterium]